MTSKSGETKEHRPGLGGGGGGSSAAAQVPPPPPRRPRQCSFVSPDFDVTSGSEFLRNTLLQPPVLQHECVLQPPVLLMQPPQLPVPQPSLVSQPPELLIPTPELQTAPPKLQFPTPNLDIQTSTPTHQAFEAAFSEPPVTNIETENLESTCTIQEPPCWTSKLADSIGSNQIQSDSVGIDAVQSNVILEATTSLDSTHFHCPPNEESHPTPATEEVSASNPLADEFLACLYEETKTDSEPIPHDQPLYEGSRLSVHDSLCSILTFSQSEHLTGSSLAKLLPLIELHLPENNNFTSTSHLFYKSLEKVDSEIQISYMCSLCWGSCASKDDICQRRGCIDQKRVVNYFINVPMIPQIKKLYSRPDFLDTIQYKNKRFKVDPENIEDVYDGKIYKECEKTILSDPKNISLQWNTDGISLYECSTYSLWPVFFSVNELPPEDRYKPENIILGGLWGSKDKPHPNIFLENIALEAQQLRNGITANLFDGSEVFVNVPVIQGTCDGPAKSTFFNFKPHSGYCSCPICLIHGEKSNRTDQVLVFPHEEEIVLRTEANYAEHLAEARKKKKDDDDAGRGVKGHTLLSSVLFTFMCLSTAVDSMHNSFMGVTKQLLNLWFNPCYHEEPFSLSKRVNEVNERLMNMNVPHFVQRLPVSVEKLAYWKASLFRNFLLYFSLPVLFGIMKPEYFDHFACYVEAISLLNSNSISPSDLLRADYLLQSFSENFQKLYGLRHMSFNVHLSRHLSLIVSYTGNLWATSCFGFENLNGILANIAHGTRHAGLQISNNLSLLTSLAARVENISSPAAKAFCEKLLSRGKRWDITDKIMDSTYSVGNYVYFSELNDLIAPLLQQFYSCYVPFQTFCRLLKSGVIYVANSYTRGSRFSCYAQYVMDNSNVYGEVVTFVRATCPTAEFAYFMVVNELNVSSFIACIGHIFSARRPNEQTLRLVPISCLRSVCFGLNVEKQFYICVPVNKHEME